MTQIVFNSQEEFENAVMDVLEKRLGVEITRSFGGAFVRVRLLNIRNTGVSGIICQDSTRKD